MHLEGQQSARTISDEQNSSLSIVRLPGGSFPPSPQISVGGVRILT